MQSKFRQDFMDRIRVKAAVLAYIVAVGESELDLGRGSPGGAVEVGYSELEKAIQDMMINENNPDPVHIQDIRLAPGLSNTYISVIIELSSGAHLSWVIDTTVAVF